MVDKNDNDNTNGKDDDVKKTEAGEASKKTTEAKPAATEAATTKPAPKDEPKHETGTETTAGGSEGSNGGKVLIGVVVVALVVYLAATWLAENRARDMVETSIATFEEDMRTQGVDAEVTYGDLRVKSFSLSPEVQMSDLSVYLFNPSKNKGFRGQVPMVIYSPESFDMQSYSLQKSGDVLLHEVIGGKETGKTLQVSHSASPVLHVEHHGNGSRDYSVSVPEWVTLHTVSGAEEDDPMANPVTISLDNTASRVAWAVAEDGTLVGQNINLQSIEVTSEEAQVATIDSLSFALNHEVVEQGEDGAYDTSEVITVAQLENLQLASPELEMLNPISVVNEITYTGPKMEAVQEGGVEGAGVLTWNLKNVAFMSGRGSVYINGEVNLEPEAEQMPFGDVTVRITDANQLFVFLEERKPEEQRMITGMKQALQKLSGADLESGEPVVIKVAREQAGRLSIGEMSLEEALAMGITLMMQMQSEVQPKDALQAPKADEAATNEDAETSAAEDEVDAVDETAEASDDEEVTEEPAAAKPASVEEQSSDDSAEQDAADDVEADASITEVEESDDGVEITIEVEDDAVDGDNAETATDAAAADDEQAPQVQPAE